MRRHARTGTKQLHRRSAGGCRAALRDLGFPPKRVQDRGWRTNTVPPTLNSDPPGAPGPLLGARGRGSRSFLCLGSRSLEGQDSRFPSRPSQPRFPAPLTLPPVQAPSPLLSVTRTASTRRLPARRRRCLTSGPWPASAPARSAPLPPRRHGLGVPPARRAFPALNYISHRPRWMLWQRTLTSVHYRWPSGRPQIPAPCGNLGIWARRALTACARRTEVGRGAGLVCVFVSVPPHPPPRRDFWNGRSWLSRGVCGRVGCETTYHNLVPCERLWTVTRSFRLCHRFGASSLQL